MFGVKLWWTNNSGCDRCGKKGGLKASPGWFSFQLWCTDCLHETGRDT